MRINWKIVVVAIGCLLICCYLVFANMSFSGKSFREVCRGVKIAVQDSAKVSFVTGQQIAHTLAARNITLTGKTMRQINLDGIEKELLKNQFIDKVECYKTLNGIVRINVWQCQPIVRIMGVTNYYLDGNKHKIPVALGNSVLVPVVTGNFSDRFMNERLFPFIQFIRNDGMWNAQIEQINVKSDSLVELVPRVGDFVIFLGTLDRYQAKLNKLLDLYTKVFKQIGWSHYSYIDLQYRNQVVCTREGTVATSQPVAMPLPADTNQLQEPLD